MKTINAIFIILSLVFFGVIFCLLGMGLNAFAISFFTKTNVANLSQLAFCFELLLVAIILYRIEC